MIFIDSNVPMYLVGAHHPHKADAVSLLERAVAGSERLVTDAEVLQEILHRYVAIGRKDAIQPALDVLLEIVDEVFVVEKDDVLAARDILLASKTLSSRDALHVAIMRRHEVQEILTFDRGFDEVAGVHRVVR